MDVSVTMWCVGVDVSVTVWCVGVSRGVSVTLWCVAVCGGRVSARNKAQHLYSHAKYGDQNYNNKEDCDWVLSAGHDHYRVRLRFLTFEVEDETDCG